MTNTHSADIIDRLQNPDAYDHPVDGVRVLQTHISWVLLAGEFAYKIKKPVYFGFLDFSSLRKRRHYCFEEVRLNRRLCPELYLGVAPIREHQGSLSIGGRRGRIVEYAVKMERLEESQLLENMLSDGRVTTGMIDSIAATLAAFHERAESGPEIARFGAPRGIRRNWEENFEQTREFVGVTISRFQYDYLRAWVEASIRRLDPLFTARATGGRVRDGHGDLRASAISIGERLCIFDCIEFNRRFRYADVAADVAFLAMDLSAKGRPDLTERFVGSYVAQSGDSELRDVIDFYICYRAYVRGKVEGFRVTEESASPDERAAAQRIARDRYALAVDVAARRQPPLLLITCGLSGSGKSSIASAIAGGYGMEIVASDAVRKQLAGRAGAPRRPVAYGTDIYTPEQTRRTYRRMLEQSRELLDEGRSVILDATFSRREWRQAAQSLARQTGALFLCVECRVDEHETRRRLDARDRDPATVSDASWETYVEQRRAFEPVDELSDWQHLVVDTDGLPDEVLRRALDALEARLNPRPVPDSSHQAERRL